MRPPCGARAHISWPFYAGWFASLHYSSFCKLSLWVPVFSGSSSLAVGAVPPPLHCGHCFSAALVPNGLGELVPGTDSCRESVLEALGPLGLAVAAGNVSVGAVSLERAGGVCGAGAGRAQPSHPHSGGRPGRPRDPSGPAARQRFERLRCRPLPVFHHAVDMSGLT